MRTKLKTKRVTLDPWNWDGVVVSGGTAKDFERWVQKTLAEPIEDMGDPIGRAYLVEGKPWALWVHSLKDVPTLAHEALHIVSGVLGARGLAHTDSSEEAYAYTLSSLLRQVLK